MRIKPDKIKQGEQFPKQFCLTGATTDEFEQIIVNFYHNETGQSVVFVKVPDPAYPDASIIMFMRIRLISIAFLLRA